MKGNYYNEWDKFAAAWLRELIRAGLIPAGDVDERSITEVRPEDLEGYAQCHFFAGIGGWPLALRLAGWPDDRPVWTASCPCQPLSGAGKRKGHADKRHLWPAFYEIVAERRPAIIFGEQVAVKDGREWLAGIRADLEALGHAFGAADLCAASQGAPHIRQRLFWVSHAASGRRGIDWRQIEPGHQRHLDGGGLAHTLANARRIERWFKQQPGKSRQGWGEPEGGGGDRGLADADGGHAGDGDLQRSGQHGQQPGDGGPAIGLGDAEGTGLSVGTRIGGNDGAPGRPYPWQGLEQAGSIPIRCSDGRWRRVPANQAGEPEPALFPLADAGTVRNRVGLLRGSGNAINPFVARAFIISAREAIDGIAS